MTASTTEAKTALPLTTEVSDSFNDEGTTSQKRGTDFDVRDMQRMGKDQQLRRNFRFITIWSFTMVLMATWEAQLVRLSST